MLSVSSKEVHFSISMTIKDAKRYKRLKTKAHLIDLMVGNLPVTRSTLLKKAAKSFLFFLPIIPFSNAHKLAL